MHSLDLNVHCEICAYSRFCETKELKGENNSVLHSLFSLPPTTYWWASSCILGKQWLKRFHRVSAIIWQIYELCWTGSKCPENNRHSARCSSFQWTEWKNNWNKPPSTLLKLQCRFLCKMLMIKSKRTEKDFQETFTRQSTSHALSLNWNLNFNSRILIRILKRTSTTSLTSKL